MSAWKRIGAFAQVRRAENPGPMTLDGTNSYVLGDPEAEGVVVVDPGPLLEGHLTALAAAGAVKLILVTHRHADHTAGSARLHELTGAPVRAALEQFCHAGATLNDGELIHAAGLTIEVLATPGHTSDSLCFAASGPAGSTVMLTGDTILGSGSTVLDYPDGRLGDYLRSLSALRAWAGEQAPVPVLPGHGPVLPDVDATAAAYQVHRAERLAQVRAAVEHLRESLGEPTAEQVSRLVYGDIPEHLQAAALLSVRAQLDYLQVG